jgi:hypothetical protein
LIIKIAPGVGARANFGETATHSTHINAILR